MKAGASLFGDNFVPGSGRLGLRRYFGKLITDIAAVHSLQELIGAVEGILETFYPSLNTALYLYDPKADKLRLWIAKGMTEEERIAAENTAMDRHPGYVYKNKKALHISDVEHDRTGISVETPRSFTVKSRLYFPVMNKEDCVGAFGLVSEEPGRFSEEDIEFLTIIANISGVVYARITKAALIEEITRELRLKERAISSSNLGMIITDAKKPDNPIMYVNKAFENITGYTFGDIVGKNCRFLQGPEKDQKGLTILRQAIREQSEITVTLSNYKKDGSQFWTELAISPVFDAYGQLTNYVGIQNDISERIRTEEKLKLSSARISSLIQHLPSAILVEDEFRRIVLVNDEFISMFRIPLQQIDLIGLDCREATEMAKALFIEEDTFIGRIDEILKRKTVVKNDVLRLKDGRVFERDYLPIYLDENYYGHLWNYRDITQRKTAEEQIEQLKKFYEQILYDLPGQIAVFDKDFRYLYVNPQSVKDQELRTWLVGKDDFEYCALRNLDMSIAKQRRDSLQKAFESRQIVNFEETITKEGKPPEYFYRVISPVLDNSGKIDKLIAYGINITARKITEIELLKIKNQLETVLKTVGEGIITVDPGGKIVMVNDEVATIWGLPQEELLGKELSGFISLSTRPEYLQELERYFTAGEAKAPGRMIRVEGMKKDGSVAMLEMKIRPTRVGDDLLYTVVVHDISEVKQLVSDLERSNKSLSEFAYIASHDLREPLRKISSFGSLLAESLAGRIPQDDQENLDFMIDGAIRMQQMIDELLFFSRLTSESTQKAQVSLTDILNELVRFELAALIEETQANITLDLRVDTCRAVRSQIKQLLQNLISNAVKYHKDNVRPEVSIKSIVKSNMLYCEVGDNGIGIDPKYHRQIFEMFKRLHSREKYSGTGIGLAICKKIVELHRGEIGIFSEKGNGSTFWFTLQL